MQIIVIMIGRYMTVGTVIMTKVLKVKSNGSKKEEYGANQNQVEEEKLLSKSRDNSYQESKRFQRESYQKVIVQCKVTAILFMNIDGTQTWIGDTQEIRP